MPAESLHFRCGAQGFPASLGCGAAGGAGGGGTTSDEAASSASSAGGGGGGGAYGTQLEPRS